MRMGWAAFIIPFVFVASPALLFNGTAVEAVTALGLSAVGIAAVTAGIVGFWSRKLGVLARTFFIVGGALALPLGFVTIDEFLHVPAALAVVVLAVALVVVKPRPVDGTTVS